MVFAVLLLYMRGSALPLGREDPLVWRCKFVSSDRPSCVPVVHDALVASFRDPTMAARDLAHHIDVAVVNRHNDALADGQRTLKSLEVQLLRRSPKGDADHVGPLSVAMKSDSTLTEARSFGAAWVVLALLGRVFWPVEINLSTKTSRFLRTKNKLKAVRQALGDGNRVVCQNYPTHFLMLLDSLSDRHLANRRRMILSTPSQASRPIFQTHARTPNPLTYLGER
mmetsp:Transcript_18266/g.33146  ORF Transcript_18266/g.33146 Transcript_18266/m.33146 type:complete len:225 (-) Transcript_18266:474-1148(-)